MKYQRMTAFEIRRSYAEAKEPKAQVKILAQLNLCKQADIMAIINNKTDELPLPTDTFFKDVTPCELSQKKLPPEKITEIVKKYKSGKFTQRQIAKQFAVSQSTISHILAKEAKAHG